MSGGDGEEGEEGQGRGRPVGEAREVGGVDGRGEGGGGMWLWRGCEGVQEREGGGREGGRRRLEESWVGGEEVDVGGFEGAGPVGEGREPYDDEAEDEGQEEGEEKVGLGEEEEEEDVDRLLAMAAAQVRRQWAGG